jgi:DNA-directed RNA polymerase subunit N (RpoN/RPB10)
MDPCKCQSCLQKITAETWDPWVNKIKEDLENGRIVHIGFGIDGRPIYRQV